MSAQAKQRPALERAKTLSLRDSRGVLKSEFARAARAARNASGLSQRELAAEIGAQPAYVARCELSHEVHALSVLHVASAPERARERAIGLIRWQADCHGLDITPRARIEHDDEHLVRLSSVMRECSDVPRVLAEALSDGMTTLDELEQIEREARESIDVAGEVLAWVAREKQRRRGGSL